MPSAPKPSISKSNPSNVSNSSKSLENEKNNVTVVVQNSDKSNTVASNATKTLDKNIHDEDKSPEDNTSQSSTDESSLPDYLRHRGRRQLGGGGGIIQAPLLSACKPGAKRDYNYKCRAKFIPQERNRRASDDPTYIKETSPSPPRIKCPKVISISLTNLVLYNSFIFI